MLRAWASDLFILMGWEVQIKSCVCIFVRFLYIEGVPSAPDLYLEPFKTENRLKRIHISDQRRPIVLNVPYVHDVVYALNIKFCSFGAFIVLGL